MAFKLTDRCSLRFDAIFWAFCGDGFIRWERRLSFSQLTGEKKPGFSGSNDPPAMLVVAFRLRKRILNSEERLKARKRGPAA